MTFTGMPNNADADTDATDDIVWTRKQVKLPQLPTLPKLAPVPVLKNTKPADGSSFSGFLKAGVSFELDFNQAMDSASLAGIHFVETLKGGQKKTIAANIKSVSGGTYKATALLGAGNYELIVPGKTSPNPVKSAGGTPLDKDYDIHFTVKSLASKSNNQAI